MKYVLSVVAVLIVARVVAGLKSQKNGQWILLDR